jgi:elongation factor P
MITTSELKKGLTIELEGQPYQIIDYHHQKLGRGSAQVRLRLRDLRGGHTTERTFHAGEKFALAQMEHHTMQYLYSDGDLYHFMDVESFEQITLNSSQLGEAINYLKEDLSLEVPTYNGEPIGVELPTTVELQIVETEPGFKGDTATGGNKPAKLETGITIKVPLFISSGDVIKVDTRTGEYVERAG